MPPTRRRAALPVTRWRAAVGVGVAAGATAAALSLVLIALPLFFFARAADPARGTGRPFIRTGLLVAGPVAAAVGVVVGMLVGRWYRRGGRLPREADGDWRS